MKNTVSQSEGFCLLRQKNGDENSMIRVMTIDDYDEVYALWKKIKGFGIRSIDDSREGVDRFLRRNPTTSVVAEEDGHIVGRKWGEPCL